MKSLQIQTQLPFQVLLDSLNQLENDELELLAQKTAILKAKKRTRNISDAEGDLVQKIQHAQVPSEWPRRSAKLTEKQRGQGLDSAEYDDLISLVDQMEQINAKRMVYLVELATLRQQSVEELIQELQLRHLTYDGTQS